MMHSDVTARAAVTAALLGLIAFASTIASCASEESIKFGLPDAGTNPGATSGGACTVNPMCAVSFKKDIFTAIIDGPAGCTGTTQCHGGDTPMGNMILKPGDAHGAYDEFVNYQLKKTATMPAGAYITPCDAKSSRLLCNTALSAGDTNPYGICGTLMPLGGAATKLTKKQLDTLAEWIACGAPEN